jgi:hypothetical protein
MNVRVAGTYFGYEQSGEWNRDVRGVAIDYRDNHSVWDEIWIETDTGIQYDSFEKFVKRGEWI